MSKLNFVLVNTKIRANAAAAIYAAPGGYRVTISEPTRSLDQNARLWATLTDIANAKPEGRNWTPETWKSAFMHYLGHQVRFAEGLDGSGPFPLGFYSSKLTVKEMADLITVVQKYADEHGVELKETRAGGWME